MGAGAGTGGTSAPYPRRRRPALAVATLLALGAFVALLLSAALAYPGGSWADAGAAGFDPVVDYWCDLLRAEAWNGAPNARSAHLARGAFGALALGQLAFWPLALGPLPRRPARAGLVAGTGAAAGLVFVASLPYTTLPTLHSLATLAAGALGFAAACLVVGFDLLRGSWRRATGLLGLGLVAGGGANLVVYSWMVLGDVRESAVLPVVQKGATVVLVLWMGALALERAGHGERGDSARDPRRERERRHA